MRYLIKVLWFALTIKVNKPIYRFRLLFYTYEIWKRTILKFLRIKYV